MSTIRMLSAFARGNRTYGASYTGAARSGAQSFAKNNVRNSELREQLRAVKQTKTEKDSRYSASYEEQEEEQRQAESGEAAGSSRKKQTKTVYTGTIQAKQNGFLERTESKDKKKDEKIKKPVRYNYKEVSGKIQRAKTSVSAGQALLSAKRKVVEMRRKISAKDGDPEELQFALTHAKRMEMVARKKKHHLELEELTEHTRERDEREEKTEEAADGLKDALISAEEEKLWQKEDEIFEERQGMLREAAEEGGTEDMLAELNEMLSEYGEEQLKELEEAMELLESMEFMDPHMSEEELEEVKRKHRAAENKAMVKADMDYLKDMIKHQTGKGAAIPAMTAVISQGFSAISAADVAGVSEGAAIDVSV